jgi:hypothetical protein
MISAAEPALSELRAYCLLATKLWGRTFSALTALTLREKGEDAVHRLWFQLLSRHQLGHYREGLRKLGIGDNEPPAVAAAKYHYFTNVLGGLDLEYVEESPKKVWIRYLAPMWTYAGVAMMAMPGGLRRTIFSAWHPRNGAVMGCPRLGWVSTKFIMEGDPYDEGYFMEYDHDLAPDEIMRYEVATHTPECDRTKLPTLDPIQWPEERKLKARRNYSAGYVRTTVEVLYSMFGTAATHYIVEQTMRCLAIQYTHELMRDVEIEGCRDASAVTSYFSELLRACGQEFECEQLNGSKHRIILRSFKPFTPQTEEGLRAACFAFQQMSARLISGRVAVARSYEKSREVWVIEDVGHWRW